MNMDTNFLLDGGLWLQESATCPLLALPCAPHSVAAQQGQLTHVCYKLANLPFSYQLTEVRDGPFIPRGDQPSGTNLEREQVAWKAAPLYVGLQPRIAKFLSVPSLLH